MSMRLYKFSGFEYETIQFSGGRGDSRAPRPLYERGLSVPSPLYITLVFIYTIVRNGMALEA